MSIIAVNDNILLTLNFHRWLIENTSFSIYTDVGCKIMIYDFHVFGSFGAFEIVVMTLDKLIAIKLPIDQQYCVLLKEQKYFQLSTFLLLLFFTYPT